jgi:TonB family protein
MANQPALAARLAAVEKMQEEWESRRLVEDCLRRVTTLEQAQQWAVALTVVEEVLETCPSSAELQQTVERLRARLRDQDRRKKLSRWVSEIREALADGDDAQAEETLQRALAALPDEPALVEMRQELDRDKQFRQEWRAAQVLVGRRHFEQAEQILVRLDGSAHPEVQTLLETVRQARAASEEQGFYKRGREKALLLIQQGQTEQAADLLRNLLSLFPGDAILERDLRSVAGRHREKQPEPHVAEEPVPVSQPAPLATVLSAPPAEPPAIAATQAPGAARWHSRPPVIAGAAFVALVSAGVGVRRMLHGSTPAPPAARKVTTLTPAPAQTVAPEVTVSADSAPAAAPERRDPFSARPRESRPVEERVARSEPPAPRRPFNPASLPKPTVAPPAALAPAPPPAPPPVFYTEIAALPAAAVTPVQVPAAPPREIPAPAQQPPAPRRTGGNLQPVRAISTPAPVMPLLAKERRISGVVTLDALVDKRGAVTNLKVISGNPLLIGSARDAVSKWLYKPATLNGEPIEAEVRIEVRFEAGSR